MKNIVFINPYISDFAAYNLWAKPIGLLRSASLFKELGFNVKVIDVLDVFDIELSKYTKIKIEKYHTSKYPKKKISIPETYKKIGIERDYFLYGFPEKLFIKKLKNISKPDLFILNSIMTYWYLGVEYTIKIIKSIYPDTPIILIGIYASLCYEHAIKYFKKYNVEVIPSSSINSNSSLNYILKKFLNYNKYVEIKNTPPIYYEDYNIMKYGVIQTITGCPFNCDFCASKILSKFKLIEKDTIYKDFQTLFRKKVKDIAFYDDSLLYRKNEHFIPIMETIKDKIKERNIRFHLPNSAHARYIDRKIAQIFKELNFKTIRISLESISNEFYEIMDKKVTKQHIIDAIRNMEESGIDKRNIEVYLMYGVPGENIKDIYEGMKFLFDLGVKIYLSDFAIVPKTKMAKVFPEWVLKEPLYHNNSIFPKRFIDKSFDENIYKEIHNTALWLNHGIEKGIKHIKIDLKNHAL